MKYPRYITCFVLVILTVHSLAQTSKILDRSVIKFSDSTLQEIRAFVPEANTLLKQVSCSRFTYESDGLKVKGFLIVPKKSGRYPCIIYNRGGTRDFGKITDSALLTRGLANIAASGYVVIASQYRGSDGGEGDDEFGGSDVNDVLNLIELLHEIPAADTSRLGMIGWSRGGIMTYMTLARTNRMKAAVVGGGVADLFTLRASRPEFDSIIFPSTIPDYVKNKDEALRSRSAMYWPEKINKNTPLLIMHGTSDWRAPLGQVLAFAEKLHKSDHPFRLVVFEGGQHSLIEFRREYIHQTIDWFNAYVRDGKKWPDLEPHGD
jgi:dipeptidyl aminopeptidase/acylaminoacyl peptidase